MKTLLKTLTVLLALSFAFNVQADAQTPEQQDLTEGKIQAGALVQALDFQTQASELISNIQFIQDMVGTSFDDTDGLLKALGEKEFFASLEKSKLDEVITKMQRASSEDELSNGLRSVRAHRDVIQKLNREARLLIK